MQSDWLTLLKESGAHLDEETRTAAHFGNPETEYDAGRNAAALFDLHDRTQIELTGEDRVTFLNNFCTNDLKKLAPGGGCEAFITNVKGRVLGHIFIYLGEESIWIETVPDAEDALIEHLDRYLITEDIELNRRSETFGELFVTGPQTIDALRTAGLEFELPSAIAHCECALPEVGTLSLRRVDWFGPPGVLLSIERDRLPNLWKCLTGAGISPAGSLAYETLRIESRFPWYGKDITDENLAQEVARNERAISFTKGCYLGQEPIARIDAMGHVNRELRGLKLERGPCPQPGDRILAPDEDKEVGRITSAVQLTAGHPPIALGYVRSKYVAPETTVVIETADERLPASVFVG